MPDEQIPASSTGSEAEVSTAPPIESWSDAQHAEWLQSGKTPEATPNTEDSATSEESSEAEADDTTAADAETAPDSETDEITEDDLGDDVKPKTRRRVSQLLTQRAELKVRLKMAEAALAKHEAKGSDQPAAKADQPAAATPAAAEKAPELDDVAADGKPKWKSVKEWQEARDKWVKADTLREFEKIQAEKAAKTTWENAQRDFQTRADEVRKELTDYDDVLRKTEQKVQLTPAMQAAVFYEPAGPRLAYWFGTHVDQAVEISKLNPVAAAFRIGKIISTLEKKQAGPPAAGAAPGAAAAPPLKKVTNAPPPATDLGARNGTSVDEAKAALAAGDIAKYMKVMNARETQKR